MKGYPKYMATKQDFLNLLSEKEYKDKAIANLMVIADLDDDMATRTLSINDETGDVVTEKIKNPLPLWKVKGFESREEIMKLVEVHND